jgi:hypothetical protein
MTASSIATQEFNFLLILLFVIVAVLPITYSAYSIGAVKLYVYATKGMELICGRGWKELMGKDCCCFTTPTKQH